jgi:hypothetical protein
MTKQSHYLQRKTSSKVDGLGEKHLLVMGHITFITCIPRSRQEEERQLTLATVINAYLLLLPKHFFWQANTYQFIYYGPNHTERFGQP